MSGLPRLLPWTPAAVALALLPSVASAQGGEVRVEIGAFRAFPPAESEVQAAGYVVAGLRGDRWWADGSSLYGEVFGGLDTDDEGGDWISGLAGVHRAVDPGGRVQGSVGLWAYGFSVGQPLTYRAATVSGSAEVETLLGGPLSLALTARGGVGGSTLELRRRDRVRRARADLWQYGGGPELRMVGDRAVVALGARVLESEGGTYRTLSLQGSGVLDRLEWNASVSVWDTPLGRETAGGVTVSIPLGHGVSLRMVGGRTDPDPLIMSEPGAQGGGVLSLRLVDLGPPERVRPVELSRKEAGPDGRVLARFRIRRPDADRVQVLADFTLWKPVDMERGPEGWTVEVELESGTYHYGFLVDGVWFVPEGAPGRVDDEWGRTNATLVVP